MAKLTPGAVQPGVQTRPSTELAPTEGFQPVTGFADAPSGTIAETAPGQGIGNSRPGIR